ncbi:MAG: heavy-metal-associated domain-containing protein [Armatimonadota bacterium]
MRFYKRPLFYVALIAIAILAASALFSKQSKSAADAAGCGMDSDMSGCAMDHSTSDKGHSDMSGCPMSASGSDSGHPMIVNSTVLSGSVLSVNKNQRKVSVRIDLPYSNDVSSVLSKAKAGDQITVSIASDKSGKPIITSVNRGKGETITLGITGIQCQACADRLQSTLRSTPGINGVTVTANPAQALIVYDSAMISVDEIKDAIRNTKPIHEGMPFGVKD